jgi:ankyrin repeat protein
MKSCTCASLDSPVEASRPSFQGLDGPKKGSLAPRKLTRKPSKLQTSMEVTRCRFGNTSRQAAPIGYEEFVPQKDWTPIYHAVYHDREGALHHYLHAGVSPDDVEGSGIPLLAVAAACGHFEIARILLEAGAQVNAVSKDKGETALHIAVKSGRHDIIDLFLEHRANLELTTMQSAATPLHYAATASGSLALVMKLLKAGARYDVKDTEGQTPAALALQANNLHAAIAIINMACGKPKELVREKDMLLQHVENTKDRSSMTNDLIADVFAVTCDPDSTVLVEAIKKNDARLVEMFLEKGADPHRSTAKGLLPIFVAVKFADLRIIRMLVQHGADVNVRGPGNLDTLQVLFKALSARDEDSIVSIVDYLLAKGADGLALYSDGKTLLHRTVSGSTDRAQVVKVLLKNGLELNAQDGEGNTALHLAAHHGLTQSAKRLLDARADTTIVDSAKRTPLFRAVLKQQWPIVRLLACPPAMTSWDAEGSTALHHIARTIPKDDNAWEEIADSAKPFCERGICRSMRDRSGATPLIQAIRSLPEDGLPVVQVLLAAGDKKWNCVGHEDHKRRDALYYAATLGKPAFVEGLLEHDAPLNLEDWTESKRQSKLPAASKHRILELLISANRSRIASKSHEPRSAIGETRIEIIKAGPRTSSALSGYGADCETERKSKPRSAVRKSTSVQHLQISPQQRKPVDPPRAFPAHTSSKQQRFQGLEEGLHGQARRSPTVMKRIEHADQEALQNARRNDKYVEAVRTSPPRQNRPDATANFPPRASSRQQVVKFAPQVSSKLSVATHEVKITPLQKEPEVLPLVPVKDIIVAGNSKTPTRSISNSPESHTALVKPVKVSSLATHVPPRATADEPKPTTSPIPLPNLSTALRTQVTTVTTDPSKQKTLTRSLAATPDVAMSGKPVQPARVDSGVSMKHDSLTKPLPTLDRTKPTLDISTPKSRRQSGDELASWLAISGMLDRL